MKIIEDEYGIAYAYLGCVLGLALFSIVWIGLSVGVNEVGSTFNNNNMIPDMPVSQQTADTTSGLITFWSAVKALEKRTKE